MFVQQRVGRLRGIDREEAAIAIGQVQDGAAGVLPCSPDGRQGFARVALGLARSMGQGQEHLLGPVALPEVALDAGSVWLHRPRGCRDL